MRLIRLGLSASALLTLLAVPSAVKAQVIVRDPCWDCRIRDDIDRSLERARIARERAEDRARDRAFDAQDRARRLEDQRIERERSTRIREETRSIGRFDQMRDIQDRTRERTAAALERSRDAQERALERSAEARQRALDRAAEARDRAETARLRIRPPSIHWMR